MQNTSLASSVMASLRRKPTNKTDSSQRAKKNSFNVGKQQQEESGVEISRQLTMQMLMQIETRLVMEQQELGKVYITKGTSVIKNGGAGVAVRHCYLEIDGD